MLRKISVSLLALSVAGFAGSAMAVTSPGGVVNVNIDVQPVVSMWSDEANINLVLDGTGQENRDTAASTLRVINNIDANITAKVDGTLPGDQVDNLGNSVNAVNFFIFNGATEAAATSAIIANANTPAGALAWTNDNLGTTQSLVGHTGVNQNITAFPVVYAADAPNVLPSVANWGLTVTYTITSN